MVRTLSQGVGAEYFGEGFSVELVPESNPKRLTGVQEVESWQVEEVQKKCFVDRRCQRLAGLELSE